MGKILKSYITPHPPIIIPEIGKGDEREIHSTSEAMIKAAEEIGNLKPDTIIVITPHGPAFRDAVAISDIETISGNFGNFGAPQVNFSLKINRDLTKSIINYSYAEGILTARITSNSRREYNIGCELDHGAMVPLYFINNHYSAYNLVHITYGFLTKFELYKFGMAIKKSIEEADGNIVVVCSGDLSHRLKDDGPYGYDPHGEIYDKQIIDHLKAGDVPSIFSMDKKIVECAGECAMRSIYILLGILDGCSFKADLLSYEGPFGVGYGVMAINTDNYTGESLLDELLDIKKEQINKTRSIEDAYVRLARESLEYYVENENYLPIPEGLPAEMLTERRGVFVSIKKEGELRGCIGTISPTTSSIASEIIRNAVEAGQQDPRFFPVEEDELEDLIYSVDVLMPAEKASKEELDPIKYGVIVRKGHRSGLLLPNLEGVDTVSQQLEIALDKAGIDKYEDYEIERFEVIRHI